MRLGASPLITYLSLCIFAKPDNQDMTTTAIESNGVALAYAEVLLGHGSFMRIWAMNTIHSGMKGWLSTSKDSE